MVNEVCLAVQVRLSQVIRLVFRSSSLPVRDFL